MEKNNEKINATPEQAQAPVEAIELNDGDEEEEEFYDFDESELNMGSTAGGYLFSPGAALACCGKTGQGCIINSFISLVFLAFFVLAAAFHFFPIPGFIFLIVSTLLVWIGIAMLHKDKMQSEIRGGRIFLASFSVLSFWFPLMISMFFAFGFVMYRTWMGNETMYPSIHIGDYILVDRITSRFAAPKHGDLVLVEDEIDEGRGPYKRAFFARVIAEPGDNIKLQDGIPYVNDKPLQRFANKEKLKASIAQKTITLYESPAGVTVPQDAPKSMPDQWYPILIAQNALGAQTNSLTLEKEQYFVLEDNRDDSSFKHIKTSYGSIVHQSRIKGNPRFILFNSREQDGWSRFGYKLK